MHCIGFPICTAIVEGDEITCRSCWIKISEHPKGYKLRAEFLAARRNFNGTKLYRDSKKALENYLFESLSRGQKRKESVRLFTIVGG